MLSPGFEINDVGFLSRANAKNQSLWFQYHQNKPRGIYRYWNYNVNQWTNYAWNNTRTDLGGNVNAHMQFKNSMWIHAGEGVNAAAAVVLRQLHARRSGAAAGTFDVGLGVARRRSAQHAGSVLERQLEWPAIRVARTAGTRALPRISECRAA